MKKYRIIEYKINGSSLYFKPQYRFLCFWRSWYRSYCIDSYSELTYQTYEEAKNHIDSDMKEKQAQLTKEKIKHYPY